MNKINNISTWQTCEFLALQLSPKKTQSEFFKTLEKTIIIFSSYTIATYRTLLNFT